MVVLSVLLLSLFVFPYSNSQISENLVDRIDTAGA
jgi:hypothetical protein